MIKQIASDGGRVVDISNILLILVAIVVIMLLLVLRESGKEPETPTTTSSTLEPKTTTTVVELADATTTTTPTSEIANADNSTAVTRKYEISYASCIMLDGLESVDCFTELALREKTVLLCNSLKEPTLRDACIRHYSLKYPEECETFGNDTVRSLECYNELAIGLNDSAYCDRLEERAPLYLRSICRQYYAYFNIDNKSLVLEMCSKVEEKDLRLYCLAMAKSDASFCRQMGNDSVRSSRRVEKCLNCANNGWAQCKLNYYVLW